jgi:hypothetical protein
VGSQRVVAALDLCCLFDIDAVGSGVPASVASGSIRTRPFTSSR